MQQITSMEISRRQLIQDQVLLDQLVTSMGINRRQIIQDQALLNQIRQNLQLQRTLLDKIQCMQQFVSHLETTLKTENLHLSNKIILVQHQLTLVTKAQQLCSFVKSLQMQTMEMLSGKKSD